MAARSVKDITSNLGRISREQSLDTHFNGDLKVFLQSEEIPSLRRTKDLNKEEYELQRFFDAIDLEENDPVMKIINSQGEDEKRKATATIKSLANVILGDAEESHIMAKEFGLTIVVKRNSP